MNWPSIRERLPSSGGLSARASEQAEKMKTQVKAGASAGHDSLGDRLSAGRVVIFQGIVAWANTPGERAGRWIGVVLGGFVALPVMLADLRFLALAAVGAVGSAWWFGAPGREFPTQPAAVLPPQAGDQWAGLVPDQDGPPAPMLAGQQPADGDPFPLAAAGTPKRVAEAVLRALKAEGIQVAGVEPPEFPEWGKQVGVTQVSGVPADIIEKSPRIETRLGLAADALWVTPDPKFRGRSVLRLLERDPFEDLPLAPYRAPRSLSVQDKQWVAMRLDGVRYELALLGVHGILVAASGGGKSTIIRNLADVSTASRDEVTWDLDPVKGGLDCFGDAISRKARSAEDITQMLYDGLRIAEARSKMFSELGMGDTWDLAYGPSLRLFADEYRQLSPEAKEIAVQIWQVGRSARVHLIAASQEGTKAVWGEAIADSIRLRIMGPCRSIDIPVILGEGRKADGWRPDRLHAGDETDPADASKAFIYGPGARTPLIYKFLQVIPEEARRRGAERAAAGMPQLDERSLERSGVQLDGTGRALSLVDRVRVCKDENAPLMAALLEIYDADQYRAEQWLPTTEVLRPALVEAGERVSAEKLRHVLGGEAKDSRSWRTSPSKLAGYTRAGVLAAAERMAATRP